jgi:hypothetical protein
MNSQSTTIASRISNRFSVLGFAALLAVTVAPASAQPRPANGGNNPPSVELPGAETGLVYFSDLTPFTLKLSWGSPDRYERFAISYSGEGQPGRVIQVNLPGASRTASKNINRLLPDTRYNFVVNGRTEKGWKKIGSLTVQTPEGGTTPTEDVCLSGSIDVRNITASQADVMMEANCEFDEYVVRAIPTDNPAAAKMARVKLADPTKKATFHLDGLSSKHSYRIRVNVMRNNREARIGEELVFITL